LVANGHIDEEIGRVQPKISFRQPALLFRNDGRGRFVNASAAAGPDLFRPAVARGAAYADIDHDGDLDVLISTNHGPASLYRNDGGNANRWLTLKLEGEKSNRSGLGATVRLESAGGRQWQTVHSGSSYCSQSDLALTFGLGKDETANLEIQWPSGARQTFSNVKSNRLLRIHESRGIVP
ncbi:MAG: CRTAC1 family protein, partial [Bryobacteraceae bacterium]|nr:CRTAC1 family protein [Bryobacteraceae bacterium]